MLGYNNSMWCYLYIVSCLEVCLEGGKCKKQKNLWASILLKSRNFSAMSCPAGWPTSCHVAGCLGKMGEPIFNKKHGLWVSSCADLWLLDLLAIFGVRFVVSSLKWPHCWPFFVCIDSAEKFPAKAQVLSKQRRRKLSALRHGSPAGASGDPIHPQLRRPLHHLPLKNEPA